MTSLSSPIRKPGPTQPLGCRTVIRCSGVEQLLDRHAVDVVHLVGATHRRPGSARATRPRTGVTAKLLGGSHSSGSSPNTSTPAGSRPVSSSASRSAACTGVSPGVDRAARERHLAGVGAHVVGALGEQQVGRRRALAEQHQDGAAARVGVLGRHEPGQVVDGDRRGAGLDRAQPLGQLGPVTGSVPRCSLTSATSSSTDSRPPACWWATGAVGVDQQELAGRRRRRRTASSARAAALGVGEQRVGHPGLRTRSRAAPGWGSW